MAGRFKLTRSRSNTAANAAIVEELKEEFDRKITAVVSCLQEKAEENIDLSNKIKQIQKQIADKENIIQQLQIESKAKDEDRQKKEDMNVELNRRLQTLTDCLNDMSEDNLRLKNALQKSNIKRNENHTSSSIPHHAVALTVAVPATGPPPRSQSASLVMGSSPNTLNTPNPSPNHLTPTSPIPTPSSPNHAAIHANPFPNNTQVATLLELLEQANGGSSSPGNDTDWFNKLRDSYLKDVLPPNVIKFLSKKIDEVKSSSESVKKILEARINAMEKEVGRSEANMIEYESKMKEMALNLKEHTQSYKESVDEYEKKLTNIESKMWDNLNKEAERRNEAEFNMRRLKKKVEELQFLLDELKDDESSEEETSEDDRDNERKATNAVVSLDPRTKQNKTLDNRLDDETVGDKPSQDETTGNGAHDTTDTNSAVDEEPKEQIQPEEIAT